MTYAGFKSLLYAGLDVEDPQVQTALKWLRRHWTLDENPGLGEQGYYYYLHVMSWALRAFGQDSITDDSGNVHDCSGCRSRMDRGSTENQIAGWKVSRAW